MFALGRVALAVLVFGALAVPESATAQPVETSKAQMRFGTQMAQRGLWNEALFRFKRARDLDPDRPEVYNNLAVAYEALGLFDEALQNYRKGLRMAPDDKGLKRNYARFVEFYQRFKPDEGPGEEGGGTGRPAGDTAESEPPNSPSNHRATAFSAGGSPLDGPNSALW